ncbi:MAG: lyase family protein [Candidatus Binatia bacterium]
MIDQACEELKSGKLLDQFVVDVIQGGAGTSTNMNVNEVIANRGLEIAGHPRGAYQHLDPNDDVNKGQSTNDSYPTALKLGLCIALERLLMELERLEDAFRKKAGQFKGVLKVGRTQLMDAVPMTLEQEFECFALAIADERAILQALIARLCEINLGGTAIGTGIAADPRFPEASRKHLADIMGYELRTASNLIAATSDVSAFLALSGALKQVAMKLSKTCNDLRLLGSGPQAGLAELRLPAVQAGSSIMPGKVNPVVPEVVNQIAFAVAGADVTVMMAAEAGQLQLNAFEPIMGHSLFTMLQWLTAGCAVCA